LKKGSWAMKNWNLTNAQFLILNSHPKETARILAAAIRIGIRNWELNIGQIRAVNLDEPEQTTCGTFA
jgi:hypothetical protein